MKARGISFRVILLCQFISLHSEAFLISRAEDSCFRRLRVSEYMLIPGEEVNVQELINRGFEIDEICLPDELARNAPAEVNFILYQVNKTGRTAGRTLGWVWEGVFLDEEELRTSYENLINEHVKKDIALLSAESNDFDKIDKERHIVHLWAVLLGKKYGYLSKDMAEVKKDIINRFKSFREIKDDFFLQEWVEINILNDTVTIQVSLPTSSIYWHLETINPETEEETYPETNEVISSIESFCSRNKIIYTTEEYSWCSLGSRTSTHWDGLRMRMSFPITLMSRFLAHLHLINYERFNLKSILGNKGYNLVRLKSMGIPVPDFTINGNIGKDTSETASLNSERFSVRSSPPVSMPGILDTILNVHNGSPPRVGYSRGLQDYAIFLRDYAITELHIAEKKFKVVKDGLYFRRYEKLIKKFKKIIIRNGFDIPIKPVEVRNYMYIDEAIAQVRRSWNSEQAKKYRAENGIPDYPGMAVIIQEMKYGNLNENSGSFVLFTRHPSTGEKGVYIEYAPQSQGDALVGGEVNPIAIEESGLSEEIIAEIKGYVERIEKEFGYVQDIEGVIEDEKVWILQTRDAILNPEAEVKALVDMVNEGMLTKEELFNKIDLEKLKERLSRPYISPGVTNVPIAEGVGASSGVVTGVIALTLESAKSFKEQGLSVILVKPEIYPTDLAIYYADGFLTQIGGITPHAAIQARIRGIPAVVGCTALEQIDTETNTIYLAGREYKQGDFITIDGIKGCVYEGEILLVEPEELNPNLEVLMHWYQEIFGE